MNHALTAPAAAVVALGANMPSAVGTPRATLEEALARMAAGGATLLARSRWFETPPWPSGSGPDYVNGAARVAAPEGLDALLTLLQRIETALGRRRSAAPGARWGPRVCDLDILCAGDLVWPGPEDWRRIAEAPPEAGRPRLVLPHPQLHRRAFALAPLIDIAPDWVHPVLGADARALFAALPEEERRAVRPLA